MTPYATPTGASTITLYGVALQDLMQPQRFGMHYDDHGKLQPGMTLELMGGMKAGLPLANPAPAGMLIRGEVYQCYGNWQGPDMHIGFVVYPSSYTTENHGNFVLNWKRGQKLSEALKACLSVAYPGKAIKINISDRVVADQDMPHVCGTLEELARTIKRTTEKHYLGDAYPGVDITLQGGEIQVFDGTGNRAIVQLDFTDFVGRPTWIGFNTISVITGLRGDIQVGSLIKMPPNTVNAPGMVGMTSNAMPGMLNYQATFQGRFMVNEVRHVGNSRAPDGTSWVLM